MNLIVPTNANGIALDAGLWEYLARAMDPKFGYMDVFLYSHGWWTTANDAASDYNRFIVGISDHLNQPVSALGVGIHWPSCLTEDSKSPLNALNALSFYTDEHRADEVGRNAGYAILSTILKAAARPLRFHLIGHSFGCRVVCSALQRLWNEHAINYQGYAFNVILLQAAFGCDELESTGDYRDIRELPSRVLATHSPLDKALNAIYPAAQIINALKGDRGERRALGGVGFSPATANRFGSRIVGRDITDIQQQYPAGNAGPGGSHSNVFLDEVYRLIASFIQPDPDAIAA